MCATGQTSMPARFPAVPGKRGADDIKSVLGINAPEALLRLLSNARRTSHAAQKMIYHQGDRCDTAFFISAGLLKLVTHLPNGRARIVRLHRTGSVIGLSGLLGRHNEHTAISVTPLATLRVPITMLQRLRAEEPHAYVWLIEHWHDYLREADTWITQFSTGPIRSRVARLLNFLSEFEPQPASDDQLLLLTCEEMSAILGVTAESVSRTLAEFKRAHILDHKVGETSEIYQTDKRRLHDIAQQ